MTEIRFEGLGKKFGEVTVLRGIDLVIHSGEFFTFVGPSGCGKSTLLNMIAGLETVTEGVIRFDGAAVHLLSPRERDVAMVFQSYALYPHMTVYENIAFPLRMRKVGRDEIDREVKRVAALLGVGDMLRRKPKELSGGQRQRVALGRAMIRRPRVFLMDEPLSNLDARLRIEMRAELKKLHRELRVTTVYVTHDQAEALSLSDRIAVLNQGRLQQTGTPREVFRKPANAFVAGFIGSPPMCFIPCGVRKSRPPALECGGAVLEPLSQGVLERQRVLLGVRPEDVAISATERTGGIGVRVSMVESAGSFDWVDVLWGRETVKGRAVPEEGLKAGDEAFLHLSRDKLFCFDPESGERLHPP